MNHVETVKINNNKEETIMYTKIRNGVSLFSGDKVEIVGERTFEEDGKNLELYLYHIVGHQTENGKPFLSLKVNIALNEEEIV